ncbi:MAG: SAM-dependent chlorinase/fluorinase [Thermodesulfobacteriota bacterium]
MKGVILGLNPRAVLVDVTHEVPAQDIPRGAFILAQAAPYFPPGTIHLVVVDPGVGPGRRGLAAYARGHYWVGPDNGLFQWAWAGSSDLTIVSLTAAGYFRPQVVATFHGRDIFAAVAAHLSLGVDLLSFGPPITDPLPLPFPAPVRESGMIHGQIIYVDHFGNLVSNIPASELRPWLQDRKLVVRIGSRTISGLSSTYEDTAPGEFLALIGSHGYLEIAGNQEHAARRLGLGVGASLALLPS